MIRFVGGQVSSGTPIFSRNKTDRHNSRAMIESGVNPKLRYYMSFNYFLPSSLYISFVLIISDFSKNHKLHPKVLFRQLKYMRENISTTPSTQTSINDKVRNKDGQEIPLIYAITPTYYRITQMAELTRLSNTLRQVKRLHWIVVEDWKFTNHFIHDLLMDANMSFTYLAQRTRSSTSYFSKGTDQRNAALYWITHNHYWEDEAVVYFADDDNTYDLRIFEEVT